MSAARLNGWNTLKTPIRRDNMCEYIAKQLSQNISFNGNRGSEEAPLAIDENIVAAIYVCC